MGTLEYLDEEASVSHLTCLCVTQTYEGKSALYTSSRVLPRSWTLNIANGSLSLSLLHGLWKSLSRMDFYKTWMKRVELNSMTVSLEWLNSVLHPKSFCCIHNM